MTLVVDTNTPGAHSEEMLAWLLDHEIPVNECYRLEFVGGVNGDRVRVFTYALNEDGAKYVENRGQGDIAIKPPYTIPVKRWLPPEIKPRESE